MAAASETICHIVELTEKSLSPATLTNAERGDVYKQLSAYAESCSIPDAIKLVEGSYPELARNWGYQILLNFVQTKWNTLTPTVKYELQKKCYYLYSNCTAVGLADSNLLQSGFAKLFVALLLRSWPKFWLEALEQINDKMSVSSSHANLSVLCESTLIEDLILDYHPVPPANKQSSIALFQKKLPLLWKQWCELLKEYASKLAQIEADTSTSDIEKKNIKNITTTCLQLFSSLCEGFASLDLILKDDFLLTVFHLLSVRHARLEAATCISEILQRKRNKENYDKLKVLFDERLLNYLTKEIALDDNEFIEKIAGILTGLGLVISTYEQGALFWASIKPVLPSYFSILLNICKFPGIRIQWQGLEMWTRILNVGDEVWSVDGVESVTTELLAICKSAMTGAVKFQHKAIEIDNDFDARDFEDEQDYIQGLGRLKNESMRVLSEIAKERHGFVMSDMCREIAGTVSDGGSNEVQWGVLGSYITSVTRALSSLPDTADIDYKELIATATSIANVSATNIHIMEGVYTSFVCFVPLLVKMQELPVIKHTLLSMVDLLQKGATQGEAGNESKSSRRAISRLVVDVFSQCKQQLSTDFDTFYAPLVTIVTNRNESSAVRAAAVEAAVMLISGLTRDGGDTLQADKLRALGASVCTEELNIRDIDHWIQYAGLDSFDDTNPFRLASNRGQLLTAVKLIYCTLKTYKEQVRATPFVLEFVVASLDWVFTQLGLLNTLFLPEHIGKLHPRHGAAEVLGQGIQERNLILERKCHDLTFNESHYVQVFLEEMFVGLYQVVGMCCKELGEQLLANQQLPNLFQMKVTKFLSVAHPAKTIRFLAYTMKAVIEIGCQSGSPSTVRLSLSLLGDLQEFLVPKLVSDWERINRFRRVLGLDVADLHVLHTGTDEEKEEIIFETVTKTVTSEYLKIMEKIMMTKVDAVATVAVVENGEMSDSAADGGSPSKPAAKGINNLLLALLGTEHRELCQSAVYTLCCGMAWCDSAVAGRCCEILLHLLNVCIQRDGGNPGTTSSSGLIYSLVFPAAISALSVNGYMELVHNKAISILHLLLGEPCRADPRLRETCLRTLMELDQCPQGKREELRALLQAMWPLDRAQFAARHRDGRKRMVHCLQRMLDPILPTNVSEIHKKDAEFPILHRNFNLDAPPVFSKLAESGAAAVSDSAADEGNTISLSTLFSSQPV